MPAITPSETQCMYPCLYDTCLKRLKNAKNVQREKKIDFYLSRYGTPITPSYYSWSMWDLVWSMWGLEEIIPLGATISWWVV